MLKLLLENIKDIDLNIVKIIYKTFNFSSILFIVSAYVLYLYSTYPISYDLLNSSLLLFKASLCTAISGFICGFIIDKHKKFLKM